jgi:hypothetical protein
VALPETAVEQDGEDEDGDIPDAQFLDNVACLALSGPDCEIVSLERGFDIECGLPQIVFHI